MSYSALTTLLRSTAAKLASLPQSVAAFLAAEETPLESVPEPYVPTTPASADNDDDNNNGDNNNKNNNNTTNEAAAAAATAAEGLHHPTSKESPPPAGAMTGITLRERATGGANPSLLGDPVSLKAEQSSLVPTPDEAGAPASLSSSAAAPAHKELRREKAARATRGPDANPSMLGDPISMMSEEGAMGRRGSKL